MRKPNTTCLLCSKSIYRRPSEIKKGKVYCSQACCRKYRGEFDLIPCQHCGVKFKPQKRTSKFCSRTCSNSGRKGLKYTKNAKWNKHRQRLELLKRTFDFKTCMVRGCKYNKTYDIHRLTYGKDGGKYEVGNMFAICPNHHAEIHRNILIVKKINNWTLDGDS